MFGNNKRIKELEHRIKLLEEPYKFSISDHVWWCKYSEAEMLIIGRYQNHNGHKIYKLFYAKTTIKNVSEREISYIKQTIRPHKY
jgi:hypothetical protein